MKVLIKFNLKITYILRDSIELAIATLEYDMILRLTRPSTVQNIYTL